MIEESLELGVRKPDRFVIMQGIRCIASLRDNVFANIGAYPRVAKFLLLDRSAEAL